MRTHFAADLEERAYKLQQATGQLQILREWLLYVSGDSCQEGYAMCSPPVLERPLCCKDSWVVKTVLSRQGAEKCQWPPLWCGTMRLLHTSDWHLGRSLHR